MTFQKLAVGLAGAVAIAGITVAAAAPAQAATPTTQSVAAPCKLVEQYWFTDGHGHVTDAPTGGNIVDNIYYGELLNVRIKGDIRYYGALPKNGNWGWVMKSKLSPTGVTWCE